MGRGRLDAHVLPVLGHVEVRAPSRADVERFARDVAPAGRLATGSGRGRRIVRGGEGPAARSLGMLGAVLEFALARGMRPDNPAKGVRRAPGNERGRVLADAGNGRLGEAWAEAGREASRGRRWA
jgi:hypothetical protein